VKFRIVALALALPLVVGALSACTAPPVPHKLTPAQACTPQTATIQWSTADQLPRTPIAANVLDYSKGANTTSAITTAFSTRPEVQYDKPWTMIEFSTTSVAAWQSALLLSVRRTGQVPETFGTSPEVTGSTLTPSHKSGKYVVVVEENVVSVPFSIACPHEKALTGTVRGPISSAQYSTIASCAGAMTGFPDSVLGLVEEYCTKA
jgi:hypothetical protein